MPWWAWILVALGVLIVLGLLAARDSRVRDFAERLEVLGWSRTLRGIWRLFRDRDAPLLPRLLVVPLVFYLVMPVDLVPDFIPVIGVADDLLVIGLTAWLMLRLLPAAVVDAHFPRTGDAPRDDEG